jgi:hypothetical protein
MKTSVMRAAEERGSRRKSRYFYFPNTKYVDRPGCRFLPSRRTTASGIERRVDEKIGSVLLTLGEERVLRPGVGLPPTHPIWGKSRVALESKAWKGGRDMAAQVISREKRKKKKGSSSGGGNDVVASVNRNKEAGE